MYRFSQHGIYTKYHFNFASLSEFLDYLQTAEVSPTFVGKEASKRDNFDLLKSHDLDEAIHMCRYGFQQDTDAFYALESQIMRELDMTFDNPRAFNDYVGYAPDVPAYLLGRPLSMINKPNPPRKRLKVYMNTSYSSSVKLEQIMHRGACVMCAIKILEMLRYSVELRLFEMSYTDNRDGSMDVHFSEFGAKNPGEQLNVQKLFFPLCHPSWIRRLNFRLIELTPDISYHWTGDYGSVCNSLMVRQNLEAADGDIIIPSIEDGGISGRDILEDARRTFATFNEKLPTTDQLRMRKPVVLDD